MAVEIPINSKKYPGLFALVDDEDDKLVTGRKWWVNARPSGNFHVYTITRDDQGRQNTLFLHRLIMDAQSGQQVDHKNQNGLDNRRENLRLATGAQNARNVGKRSHNTSGYKGVGWREEKSRWIAQITIDGRNVQLGYHDDPVEAAMVYDYAAREAFGEFASLNFPYSMGLAA